MESIAKALEIGQSLPAFDLKSHDGIVWSPTDGVGKWTLLVFYLQDGAESCRIALQSFEARRRAFQKLGVQIVAIGVESAESHAAFAQSAHLSFPLLSDANALTFNLFGTLHRAEPTSGQETIALERSTFLIDPNLRIFMAWRDVTAIDHAQTVFEASQAIIEPEPVRLMVNHAPVLLVPNVLPLELRQKLIGQWETENVDSGFMKQIDGQTVGLLDPKHKIRRDHFMKPGPLQTELQSYIGQRVVPDVKRAFNYSVTRREDFRIACYDASRGGYFRPHRDNTTDGTAHRRFAMSLLLNDEYEGGELRFPEYGMHRYRPAAGSAVVFSCSLLHEALDVTAGRRFVLLSFFYGEAEAKAREEYAKRNGAEYRA